MLTQQAGLSNIQKELLKLYANGISDQELLEVKALLAKHFADKATEAMDKFLDENGIDTEEMMKWSYEHNRRENSN